MLSVRPETPAQRIHLSFVRFALFVVSFFQ